MTRFSPNHVVILSPWRKICAQGDDAMAQPDPSLPQDDMVSRAVCISLIVHHFSRQCLKSEAHASLLLPLLELIHLVACETSGGDIGQVLKDVLRCCAIGDSIGQLVKILMHGHSELFHGKRKFEHERWIAIGRHHHPGRAGGRCRLSVSLGLIGKTQAGNDSVDCL